MTQQDVSLVNKHQILYYSIQKINYENINKKDTTNKSSERGYSDIRVRVTCASHRLANTPHQLGVPKGRCLRPSLLHCQLRVCLPVKCIGEAAAIACQTKEEMN